MSAGTLSPTLMCTISPGTRFRARNVSSWPSRRLKTNWTHDTLRSVYTKVYQTEFSLSWTNWMSWYNIICKLVMTSIQSSYINTHHCSSQLVLSPPTTAFRNSLKSEIFLFFWHVWTDLHWQNQGCLSQFFTTYNSSMWSIN
jgi:hypothetical protein